MKTIRIPPQATDINALLEQARLEDLVVRTADGTEFMVTVVDELEEEIARTRRNTKLMAMLDERAIQTQTVSLEEVKQQLDLSK